MLWQNYHSFPFDGCGNSYDLEKCQKVTLRRILHGSSMAGSPNTLP